MGQAERLYKIKQQLDTGRCLGKDQLLNHLGVSRATLKRDIAHLRERMNAPVVWDREQAGWRLDAAAQLPGTQYELPGLAKMFIALGRANSVAQLLEDDASSAGEVLAAAAPVPSPFNRALMGLGLARQLSRQAEVAAFEAVDDSTVAVVRTGVQLHAAALTVRADARAGHSRQRNAVQKAQALSGYCAAVDMQTTHRIARPARGDRLLDEQLLLAVNFHDGG